MVLKAMIINIKQTTPSPLILPLIASYIPPNIQSTSNPNDHLERSPKLLIDDVAIRFQSYFARLSSTVLALAVNMLPQPVSSAATND